MKWGLIYSILMELWSILEVKFVSCGVLKNNGKSGGSGSVCVSLCMLIP